MDRLSLSSLNGSRRDFLRRTAAGALALGVAGWSGAPLWAETRIAARIAEAEQSHPLVPALKLANQSLETLAPVKDYEAIIVKNELVGGKVITARMQMKLREEPKSVYLKFVEPKAGREVIWQDGKHNGNLVVHEVGIASLVGKIELDPTGKMALQENRYPITKIGLRNMLTYLIERWLGDTKLTGLAVKYYPNAKVGDVTCKVIEVTYPQKKDGVKYNLTRLYIDGSTTLPVRLQNYDFPAKAGEQPVLAEDYLYMNLKTNVGLKDVDFDPENPAYSF
jgi:hypothetical protein